MRLFKTVCSTNKTIKLLIEDCPANDVVVWWFSSHQYKNEKSQTYWYRGKFRIVKKKMIRELYMSKSKFTYVFLCYDCSFQKFRIVFLKTHWMLNDITARLFFRIIVFRVIFVQVVMKLTYLPFLDLKMFFLNVVKVSFSLL